MGWLQNKIGAWATNTQKRELEEFVSRLRAMDSSEIGMIVACATHHRHFLAETRNWDLLEPVLTEMQEPTLAIQLGQYLRALQKAGRPELAAGYMVWLHTVRAASSLDLRDLGRQMWKELARGFLVAEDQGDAAGFILGISFDAHDCERFPSGLTPTPV